MGKVSLYTCYTLSEDESFWTACMMINGYLVGQTSAKNKDKDAAIARCRQLYADLLVAS
jgi:hypothetical protein